MTYSNRMHSTNIKNILYQISGTAVGIVGSKELKGTKMK
jgi:hypothetical protein